MIALLLALALTTCPATGDAKQATARDLDLLKNRDTAPADTIAIPIEQFVAPGNDVHRFDPRVGVRTTAYIVGVKVGGIETANCHAKDPAGRDIHIELGAAPNVPPRERVIVEVTPRWKAALGSPTVATLKRLVGQRVTVSGWPLFDAEHANMSTNTNPAGRHNWRATANEIHPVTKIERAP